MTSGQRMRLFGESVYSSIKEFAQAVKMAPPNLQKYMNDEREPGSGILRRLYDIGCNINWLLTGNGNMFADNEIGRSLRPRVQGNTIGEPEHLYVTSGGDDGEAVFTLRIKIKGKKITVSEIK